MTPNPYASFLGGREPLAVMLETPQRLKALTSNWNSQDFERSTAPGKWSARRIVAHLADCEIAFGLRIRQTLAEDNPAVQPFDQDRWAAYDKAYTADQAMACFAALRSWNNALLSSLPSEAWGRAMTHPERGVLTLRTMVELIGGHDLNHIAQIESIGPSAH